MRVFSHSNFIHFLLYFSIPIWSPYTIPPPPLYSLSCHHHTVVHIQAHAFFNLRSTALGSSFQYIHKSIEIRCSILYLRAFFSREGMHSFLQILKENHTPQNIIRYFKYTALQNIPPSFQVEATGDFKQ